MNYKFNATKLPYFKKATILKFYSLKQNSKNNDKVIESKLKKFINFMKMTNKKLDKVMGETYRNREKTS